MASHPTNPAGSELTTPWLYDGLHQAGNSTLSFYWLPELLTTVGVATALASSPPTHLIAIRLWIRRFGLMIAFFFGLVGNVLTILIIRRLNVKGTVSAMDRYYLGLAVSDLVVNFTVTLNQWIVDTGYRIYANHDVLCKLGVFLSNASEGWSAWILLSMASQRALSVVWPHKVALLCTSKRSIVVIVVIVILLSGLNAHILYGYKTTNNNKFCSIEDVDYYRFIVNYWSTSALFIFSILPFIGLFMANSVLIWHLRATVVGDQLGGSDVQLTKRKQQNNSVTLTAIAVSVAFVALTAPLCVYNGVQYLSPTQRLVNSYEAIVNNFLQGIFYCLFSFNHSINFYIYCLTGSRFRSECRRMLFGGPAKH